MKNGLKLLGIDIGKNSFHLIGHDAGGHQVLRKCFNRNRLLQFAAQIEPCTIAMESCGGSHWLARKLASLGHRDNEMVSPIRETRSVYTFRVSL